jgi:hypothetical protein
MTMNTKDEQNKRPGEWALAMSLMLVLILILACRINAQSPQALKGARIEAKEMPLDIGVKKVVPSFEGGNGKRYARTGFLHPSFLITIPVSKIFNLTLAPMADFLVSDQGENSLSAGICLGAAAVERTGRWSVRPEWGIQFGKQPGGLIWTLGLTAACCFKL